MAGEKTEKATPKRKKDERKKGNVFMSREIITVASLLASFFSFQLLAPVFYSSLTQSLEDFINLAATMDDFSAGDIGQLLIQCFVTFLLAAFPLMIVCCLVAIVLTFAQTKLLF